MEINNAVEARQQGINSDPVLDRGSSIAMDSNSEVTDQAIADAIEQAQTSCQKTGAYSSECATAWDTVEEMQTSRAHQLGEERPKTPMEKYCEERPSAEECRVYDV